MNWLVRVPPANIQNTNPGIMSNNQVQKHKWISDAAYFNSLKHEFNPDQDMQD